MTDGLSSGGFYDERLYSTSIVCLLNSIRRGIQGQGPWPMESPENHPKGSLVVSFLFLLEPKGDPAQRSAFGKEKGGCEYGAFAAPAEAQCSWLLLTPRRFFSFSKRERKEWGRKNAGGQCPPLRHLFWHGGKSRANNPSVTAAPCHLPLHKGGIRCGGAEKRRPHRGRLSEQGHLVIFRQVAEGACGLEVFNVGL